MNIRPKRPNRALRYEYDVTGDVIEIDSVDDENTDLYMYIQITRRRLDGDDETGYITPSQLIRLVGLFDDVNEKERWEMIDAIETLVGGADDG